MVRRVFPSDVARGHFELVREMLESARRKTRPRKHDLYDVYCAVLYFLHTGVAWRSMPPDFPPWRTVHEYFTQWSSERVGEQSLLELTLDKLNCDIELARLQRLMAPR